MGITNIYPWQQELWQSMAQRYARGNLAHAYLLVGEQGIGKREFAIGFAQYLLCTARSASAICGHCKACDLNSAGTNPDLFFIGPEEGSAAIKIEQIRQLGKFSQQTAHGFGNRVIIISPAEALGPAAANSLLKVLEEPPTDTFFLLISHQPGLLMPTVRSRCQPQVMPVPTAQALSIWLQGVVPPATSKDDMQGAMLIAKGRPLIALAALAKNLPAQRKGVLQALSLLMQNRIQPVELAKQLDKSDRQDVLSILLVSLANLIRFQSSAEQRYMQNEPELQELATIAGITPANGLQQSRTLLKLYEILNNHKRLLDSTSNPNPQLLMETSLIAWQQSMAHLAKAGVTES